MSTITNIPRMEMFSSFPQQALRPGPDGTKTMELPNGGSVEKSTVRTANEDGSKQVTVTTTATNGAGEVRTSTAVLVKTDAGIEKTTTTTLPNGTTIEGVMTRTQDADGNTLVSGQRTTTNADGVSRTKTFENVLPLYGINETTGDSDDDSLLDLVT